MKCLENLQFISIGMIYVHNLSFVNVQQDQQMESIEHLMKSIVLPLSENNLVSDDFQVILPFTAQSLFQSIVKFNKFNLGSLNLLFQSDEQMKFKVKDRNSYDNLQISFEKDLRELMSRNKSDIDDDVKTKFNRFLTAREDQRKSIKRVILQRNTNSQKKVNKKRNKKIRVNPKIMLPSFPLADGTEVTKKFGEWLCEGITKYNKNDDSYKITFSGELKERGLKEVQEIVPFNPIGGLKWPNGTIVEKKFARHLVTGKVTGFDRNMYTIVYDNEKTEQLPERSVSSYRKKNADEFPDGTFVIKQCSGELNISGKTVYHKEKDNNQKDDKPYSIKYHSVHTGFTREQVLKLLETAENPNDPNNPTKPNESRNDDNKDGSSDLSDQEAVKITAKETKTTASKEQGRGVPDDEYKCCAFDKFMHVKEFMKKYSKAKVVLIDGVIYFAVDEKNIKYVGI